MADITFGATETFSGSQADAVAARPGLLRRFAWERMLALGFCAAFWVGVAYLVFH